MLQISHLYADYGGKPALEDINLTLESGELLVVLGPSGCGKTTLLNLIAGFVPYQHGSIQLAGKRIEGPGAERGVVFQNEGLLPWRNVQDNVAFGLQLAGIEKMQRLEIAHQMLKKWGWKAQKNAISGSFPVVNVSGWGLPARWRRIPAVITRRTVWCAGRLHPRPDANSAAETLAGDGQAGAVDYPRYRRSGVYGD